MRKVWRTIRVRPILRPFKTHEDTKKDRRHYGHYHYPFAQIITLRRFNTQTSRNAPGTSQTHQSL